MMQSLSNAAGNADGPQLGTKACLKEKTYDPFQQITWGSKAIRLISLRFGDGLGVGIASLASPQSALIGLPAPFRRAGDEIIEVLQNISNESFTSMICGDFQRGNAGDDWLRLHAA